MANAAQHQGRQLASAGPIDAGARHSDNLRGSRPQDKICRCDAKTGRHPATPVGTIVFPRYSADAANALVPLDATEKLALLLGDRIWIGYPMTQHHVQEFLSWLAPVPAYRLSYSSLEAARSLLEQLDD
ncbi:hypothetical protein [Sphingopyxis macrogoltabida]|uniref:hypothetical protein n=1 Tax=Sphingopyxis macrogoltabida TaxID=33050 RepID=UPI001F371B67|nr:hypothetical protein [Sphingopyxis macrogoltabida]